MSGTCLFYNGIVLQDCELVEYANVVETDDSGTDLLFSRIRITVKSMIVSMEHPSTVGGAYSYTRHPSAALVPSTPSEAANSDYEAVDQLRIAEARLQEPRKDFWLAVHGTPTPSVVSNNPTTSELPFSGFRIVLAATGEYDHKPVTASPYPEFIRAFPDGQVTNAKRNDHIDCNNGPLPVAVNVSIVGGRLLRVQFTIEVCVNICRGDTPPDVPPVRDSRKVKGVLSNRWSVSEDLDANFCTTHNIDGVLVVSDHRYKAQAMRTMVHPGLFPYAKLESRRFTVDPTGKKLAYNFVIREVGNAPPKGLVDWSATYSESSAMGTANQFGVMNISVRGSIKRPANQTQQQQKTMLLRLIYVIIQSRLTGINRKWKQLPGNNPASCIVDNCVITEDLKSPSLEARVHVRHTGSDMDSFGMRLENMGKPITLENYDPRWWPIPGYFQYDVTSENDEKATERWGGSYFEQYNQSPCDMWHSLPRGAKTDEIALATAEESSGYDHHPPSETKKPKHDFFATFEAYAAPVMDGETPVSIYERPVAASDRFGLDMSDENKNFAYLSWDSYVRLETTSGMVQLPFSQPYVPSLPGTDPPDPEEPDPEEPESEDPAPPPPPYDSGRTAVTVSLHSPIAQRVISIKAVRSGAWPKAPAPVMLLERDTGYTETLLSHKSALDTPKLGGDNATMVYAIQSEFVYALSRPPIYSAMSGGYVSDKIHVGSSPIDKTTEIENRVSVMDFIDAEGIFA